MSPRHISKNSIADFVFTMFFFTLSPISLPAQDTGRDDRIYLKDYGRSLPRITWNDFLIGSLMLKMPFDSVLAHLGPPDSSVKFPDEWSDFTANYYPKLVVWTGAVDNRVWTLDIYDPAMVTSRGLKIGDSVDMIDRVYPTKTFNVSQRRFSRVGPYDSRFGNYSEYRLYDFDVTSDEGWLIILFTQQNTLTKILLYVGVPE